MFERNVPLIMTKYHFCVNVLITLLHFERTLTLLEDCLFITLREPFQNVGEVPVSLNFPVSSQNNNNNSDFI